MRQTTAMQSQTVPAKERILAAAIQRFARHSYEDTGLRDIAADADVDVAYVHRSYGSKEQLFVAAIRATIRTDHMFAGDGQDLNERLAELAINGSENSLDMKVSPLDIIVRSLSSPVAASILREFIVTDFIVPMGLRLNEPAGLRAAIIGAFLAGVRIFKDVLEIKEFHEINPDILESFVAKTIAYVDSIAFSTDQSVSKAHRQDSLGFAMRRDKAAG